MKGRRSDNRRKRAWVRGLFAVWCIAGSQMVALGGVAHAATTVSVSNMAVTYTAAAGTDNTVSITQPSPGTVVLEDSGAVLSAGYKCSAVTSHKVQCASQGGINAVSISVGNLDDTVMNGTSLPAVIIGGDGADSLWGGSAKDTLDGGNGDDLVVGLPPFGSTDTGDVIKGGAGNDKLYGMAGDDSIDDGAGDDWLKGGSGNDSLGGGLGKDDVRGDAGTDTVNYTRSLPLTVSLDDIADDGRSSEGDNVHTDVENIDGGDGDDLFQGSDAPNTIWAGVGHDYVNGRGGPDSLYGSYGDDEMTGWSGDDTISGGSGNDNLHGADGWDSVDGGFDFDVCGVAPGGGTTTGCESTV